MFSDSFYLTRKKPLPPQRDTEDAEIRVPAVENPGLKGNPSAGQTIAMHASTTARNLFLSNFYLPGPISHLLSTTTTKKPNKQKLSRNFPVSFG